MSAWPARLVARLRHELRGGFDPALAGWRDRGFRATWLGVAVAVAIAVAAGLSAWPPATALVDAAGRESASLPLWEALARLPGSLVVPALNLPPWGAVAQVLLVFGLVQASLGARRVALVGLAAHVGATLAARIALLAAPFVLPGLTRADVFTRDTGPSVAVAALAVHLAARRQLHGVVALVTSCFLVEVVVRPDLAGYEHLVGIAIGLALAWVGRPRPRRLRPTAPARPAARLVPVLVAAAAVVPPLVATTRVLAADTPTASSQPRHAA
jgi:hypothetical protein